MKKNYNNPVGVGKYTGLLFVAPFVLGFVLFMLYPFISSFITGMTDYNGISPPKFIGLDNYISMFRDKNFLKASAVTLRYTFILVPLKIIISLAVALILNLEIKGIGIYRTIFYIPSILGSNLAIVIMWQFLFTDSGLINQLTGMNLKWYSTASGANAIIILLRLWEFGSAMIIFLNALREIPKEYYEASELDGCGKIQSFFYITLPLLKDVIFLNLILQLISAMQEFNAPYMITGGAPLKETYTIGMLIYDEMFRYHNAGYANAVSWVLFVCISLIVLLFHRSRRGGQ